MKFHIVCQAFVWVCVCCIKFNLLPHTVIQCKVVAKIVIFLFLFLYLWYKFSQMHCKHSVKHTYICVCEPTSVLYLPCSTFLSHTKLSNTYSVYFHPQLYILFSVLSSYSSSFLIVPLGWLSASEVPLLLLPLGSSAWGASFSGPG